ncbi:MAG TPA: hypothetical protein VNL71_09295 [Chloroflexota bacterium]|nr:hypothetical protein [Chloroflexota bacterium]
MLPDWHHLAQKCRDLASPVYHGRPAKARVLRRLYRCLRRCEVAGAPRRLVAYRSQARNLEAVEAPHAYLAA